MEDNMTILSWAQGVCEAADEAHVNGDDSLQAQIGRNPSFKLYFENVHKLHNIQIAQFPQYFPSQFKELTRLHEAYVTELKVTEAVVKTDTLEARFEKLEAAVMAFIESQKPVVTEEVKPAKKTGKKPAPVVEADETEADTQEADAESEA
jgi:hypothetical protein